MTSTAEPEQLRYQDIKDYVDGYLVRNRTYYKALVASNTHGTTTYGRVCQDPICAILRPEHGRCTKSLFKNAMAHYNRNDHYDTFNVPGLQDDSNGNFYPNPDQMRSIQVETSATMSSQVGGMSISGGVPASADLPMHDEYGNGAGGRDANQTMPVQPPLQQDINHNLGGNAPNTGSFFPRDGASPLQQGHYQNTTPDGHQSMGLSTPSSGNFNSRPHNYSPSPGGYQSRETPTMTHHSEVAGIHHQNHMNTGMPPRIPENTAYNHPDEGQPQPGIPAPQVARSMAVNTSQQQNSMMGGAPSPDTSSQGQAQPWQHSTMRPPTPPSTNSYSQPRQTHDSTGIYSQSPRGAPPPHIPNNTRGFYQQFRDQHQQSLQGMVPPPVPHMARSSSAGMHQNPEMGGAPPHGIPSSTAWNQQPYGNQHPSSNQHMKPPQAPPVTSSMPANTSQQQNIFHHHTESYPTSQQPSTQSTQEPPTKKRKDTSVPVTKSLLETLDREKTELDIDAIERIGGDALRENKSVEVVNVLPFMVVEDLYALIQVANLGKPGAWERYSPQYALEQIEKVLLNPTNRNYIVDLEDKTNNVLGSHDVSKTSVYQLMNQAKVSSWMAKQTEAKLTEDVKLAQQALERFQNGQHTRVRNKSEKVHDIYKKFTTAADLANLAKALGTNNFVLDKDLCERMNKFSGHFSNGLKGYMAQFTRATEAKLGVNQGVSVESPAQPQKMTQPQTNQSNDWQFQGAYNQPHVQPQTDQLAAVQPPPVISIPSSAESLSLPNMSLDLTNMSMDPSTMSMDPPGKDT